MISSADTSARVRDAALRLVGAATTGEACAPVRDLIGRDGTAAYAVQQQLTQARLDGGARVVGRKIGLTSPAVQAQLGVDQPDFGVLFDDMVVAQDEPVATSRLLQPRIEAEIAFVLGADLDTGPLDAEQVRGAVAYSMAALEIVDSRITGWDITFADTVADNGSSALFVLGEDRQGLDTFVPLDAEMTMWRGDDVVSTGNGAACLGDPLAALAWLARTAREVGDPLRAGYVVLSGALGPMVAVAPGNVFRAEISGLGSVTAHFAPSSDDGNPT